MPTGDEPTPGSHGPPEDRLADRGLDQPHPTRLAPDHPRRDEILAAHHHAVEAGHPGYLDPATGLFVLTASYLRDRGVCCATGCRHCPYLR